MLKCFDFSVESPFKRGVFDGASEGSLKYGAEIGFVKVPCSRIPMRRFKVGVFGSASGVFHFV